MINSKFYPIFISRTHFSKIFGVQKTKTFELIKHGHLKTAKVGGRTLISFASAIEFALSSLRSGNGAGALNEIFFEKESLEAWQIAEGLMTRLCHIHCSCGVSYDSDQKVIDREESRLFEGTQIEHSVLPNSQVYDGSRQGEI